MPEETTTEDIVTKTKEYTDEVRTAIYGKEVRSAIADSIDGIAQNVKDEIARDTVLNDLKTGVDGTVYDSAGDAVREQINGVKDDLFKKADVRSFDSFEQIPYPISNEWNIGNVNGSNYNYGIVNRLCVTGVKLFEGDIINILNNSEYRFAIGYGEGEDATWLSNGYTTDAFEIDTDIDTSKTFRFLVARNDDAEITVDDFNFIKKNMCITNRTKYINNDETISFEVEQGSITNTGEKVSSDTRKRMNKIIVIPKGYILYPKKNFEISVKYYKACRDIYTGESTNTFLCETAWSKIPVAFTKDTPALICIRKEDNSTYSDWNNDIVIEKISSKEKCNNFMHISFDDCKYVFDNLKNNSYSSIFEEPFLKKLQELNALYGAKFSLYCYDSTSISTSVTQYQQDFIDNSNWLKIGFHSSETTETFESATYETGKSKWNDFITKAYALTGGYLSIDRFPRLGYFKGSLNALKGMRDAKCGAIGFLSADDDRETYYLSETQIEYLRSHDLLYDTTNGLAFYSTDFRLDWFYSDFTDANDYDVPIKNTPYEELVYRYSNADFGNKIENLTVFTHEWQVYDGTTVNESIDYLEQACKFAYVYGYNFDFPQNRISSGFQSIVV